METTITKTVVNTTETVRTGNAVYTVSSMRSNGTVSSIVAQVTAQTETQDGDGNPMTTADPLGTLTYYGGNGVVRTDGMKAVAALPVFISEFLEIVEMVKSRE